jgi:voltage-gated potassium channel
MTMTLLLAYSRRMHSTPPVVDDLVRSQWRSVVRILAIVTVLTVLYLLMPLQTDRAWLGLVIGLVALICIAPFAVRRAVAVSNSPTPMLAAAEAILIVVSMLIFGFSSVYLAVGREAAQFEGLDTRIDAVYFTVATLSTVGYGDVHAEGQLARGLVTLQILFDLSLLAVSVKLLLGAARQGRTPTV